MPGPDDDLERLFRLEYSPDAPAPAALDTWSTPRHSPADVATETAPAGATAAAQLARSRELHGGWRWTPEQKSLRALVKAQQRVGFQLDQLTHIGARVLHARRAPSSAQPVDHIVVGARGVFIIVDVLSTPIQPVAWHAAGHLSAAGISMRLFEESMVQLARDGIGATEHRLGERWRIPVELVLIVVDAPTCAPGTTQAGATVGQPAAVKQVVTGPFTPALFDATDIAVIADAVARVFPSAA